MLALHPKLDLRVQDGRLENRLENREGFGVRQTLGLGHLAPRVARRKWLPSVRSSDKAVNTSLFAHLWSLECVPSLGAGWLSWLDLADNPAVKLTQLPAPPVPKSQVCSITLALTWCSGLSSGLHCYPSSRLLMLMLVVHPRQLLCLGSGCNKPFPHLGHGRGKRHVLTRSTEMLSG